LKPALHKPAAAFAALNELLASPDRDLFRKKLIECKSPYLPPSNGRITICPVVKEVLKSHKKKLRETIKSKAEGFRLRCDNKECNAVETPDVVGILANAVVGLFLTVQGHVKNIIGRSTK